jgi:hypothetical protein
VSAKITLLTRSLIASSAWCCATTT